MDGLEGLRPTALAVDPHHAGRCWLGTARDGVFRSEDAGARWSSSGLEDREISALASSPARRNLLWAGTEPSAVFRSTDGGAGWEPTADLGALPSAATWAFPPKPETHHVRWISCDPTDPDRLHIAIEAGALLRTSNGGRSWTDRVPGGPMDTHELALHPDRPDHLRVAAGDGFFESRDGGDRWERRMDGAEVGYFRSVVIDPGNPDTVLTSAAAKPRTAYVAGRSDGRLLRREGGGSWARVREGWPDPPATIAPLLRPGTSPGELWAADERGVHRSVDGGRRWTRVAVLSSEVGHLRGFERVPAP